MPRVQKTAPNATVRMKGKQDQRRDLELEYDRKFPDKKHFWKGKDSDSLRLLVSSGVAEVVKDKDGVEVGNRISVLCSMDKSLWDARNADTAELSYQEVKAYRGNFEEMDVPLRQFANFKTPESKE